MVDKHVEMAPKVGMNFDCEEKAYEMYNTYAGLVGFSVRKSRTKHRKSDNSLSQKYFVCSGEGHRKNEASQMDITRTGCDAVQFSISKENV
jgi:zinc finger SWIM domain-containing protein 3